MSRHVFLFKNYVTNCFLLLANHVLIKLEIRLKLSPIIDLYISVYLLKKDIWK